MRIITNEPVVAVVGVVVTVLTVLTVGVVNGVVVAVVAVETAAVVPVVGTGVLTVDSDAVENVVGVTVLSAKKHNRTIITKQPYFRWRRIPCAFQYSNISKITDKKVSLYPDKHRTGDI